MKFRLLVPFSGYIYAFSFLWVDSDGGGALHEAKLWKCRAWMQTDVWNSEDVLQINRVHPSAPDKSGLLGHVI